MRDTNFKVGDRIRIRQYEDMKAEFGVDSRGDIAIAPIFNKRGMSWLCGKQATIAKIKHRAGKTYDVELKDKEDEGGGDWKWTFTTDMIEKVEGKEMPMYKVGDKVMLRTLVDLIKEYGAEGGSIKTPIRIQRGMAKFVKEHEDKPVTISIRTPEDCSVKFVEDECHFIWSDCVILRKADEDKPVPKGGEPVGVIKSLDDVRTIIEGKEKCSDTPCGSCVINKKFGSANCKRAQLDAYQFCINYVEGKGAEKPQPEEKVTRKPLGSGKCKDCVHKEPLAGGYYFCQKWHNVTLEDGYCHYYEKLEKKKEEVEEE